MSLVKNLGHVGIICDDSMKMRDFYTRVIGLTVTDEDPDRGSCFLSADPENEHHELALGQARGPEHPDGARPATQNVGQISYIVPDLAALRGAKPPVPGRRHRNSPYRYPRHFGEHLLQRPGKQRRRGLLQDRLRRKTGVQPSCRPRRSVRRRDSRFFQGV